MKAVVCTKYGPPEVLKVKEVEKPTPKKNEVCIKIHASAVTQSDIFVRGSRLPFPIIIPFRLMIGITKPRKSILGFVLSGEIDSVGEEVTRFKKGDQVYGFTGFSLGAYAQYTCMSDKDSKIGCLTKKPANQSHEEAAASVYGGMLALQYLQKGNIQKGQKVLIYGASGSSGTTAVQIAKYIGTEVTGVCSTANLEMVKSLGADKVIDYTKQDTVPEGEYYDLILDSVGKIKTSKLKYQLKNALTKDGKYVSIDDGDLKLNSKRLIKLKEMIEAGKIKPIIDRTYPMEEIVEAHRYVEKGHKKGNVIIKIDHNGNSNKED